MKNIVLPKTMKVHKPDKISKFEDCAYRTIKCPHCDQEVDADIKKIAFTASIDGETDENGDRVYGYDGHDHAFLQLTCTNPKCKKTFVAEYYKSDCLKQYNHLIAINSTNKDCITAFKNSVKESYRDQEYAIKKLKGDARKLKIQHVLKLFAESSKMLCTASKSDVGKATLSSIALKIKSLNI